jgi:dephospho-CoA kinase
VPNRPYVVALTGGIGSGKSTVADGFAAHGIALVDADMIARELTEAGGAAMPAIRAAFGDAMLEASGALDRARMRQAAFTDDSARGRLEAILHPMIREKTVASILAARSSYVMWVVPLLFESGSDGHANAERVLVVDCPEELQIARVMTRSGLSRVEVEAIMARQCQRAERLRHADDVIDNQGSRQDLEAPIARLHARYLELATKFEQERL